MKAFIKVHYVNNKVLYRAFQYYKTLSRQYSQTTQPHNHATEAEKLEYHDTEEILDQKAAVLSDWISSSKQLIAFTGAGISTSAGIPDYRSGHHTIVPTGPGQWEPKTKDHHKPSVNLDRAIPTFTHLALYELMNKGLLKFVISQNVDGLHMKSGLDPTKLAELHGNANIEKCSKCNKHYLRDYKVRKTGSTDHITGNLCDDPMCRGPLLDNIIHFGDSLDKTLLQSCLNKANKADLCLALGSSIRVRPAAMFPTIVAKKGKLAIVNLQSTPLDLTALRVNSLCDPFMQKLMRKLGIEVREFNVRRRVGFRVIDGKVIVRGLDSIGNHFSVLKKVKFGEREVMNEPFEGEGKRIELFFQGHYGEPPFVVEIGEGKGKEWVLEIEFCMRSGVWSVVGGC